MSALALAVLLAAGADTAIVPPPSAPVAATGHCDPLPPLAHRLFAQLDATATMHINCSSAVVDLNHEIAFSKGEVADETPLLRITGHNEGNSSVLVIDSIEQLYLDPVPATGHCSRYWPDEEPAAIICVAAFGEGEEKTYLMVNYILADSKSRSATRNSE